MLYNKTKMLAIIAGICTLISCKQFVDIDPPKTQLLSNLVFENETTAQAAIANVYRGFAGSGFASGNTGSVSALCGLAADEYDLYATAEATQEIYRNAILPTNISVSNIWAATYNLIYQTNAIMEGLEKSVKLPKTVKEQLRGECLFMRAFVHFYLTNLYGDVPYITTTDYRINTSVVKMPVIQVLDRVVADLIEAKRLLTADYLLFGQERVRATKWSSIALLARTYLYKQDWDAAEKESDLILNQLDLFELQPLSEVFLKNSKEAIWQLKPVSPSANTPDGVSYILTSRPIFVALSNRLANAFEDADQRRQAWVGNFTNAQGSWDYAFKYKIRTGAVPLNEYSMVFRLAEQYLIRAEARGKQDKMPLAIADLDAIRSRAGLPGISENKPAISKEDLLQAIAHERRLELFSEWGHRWFDLKRTGKADAILGALKPTWKSTAVLFPIPASEIIVNTNMVQNIGYN